jgi:hypothetical protein
MAVDEYSNTPTFAMFVKCVFSSVVYLRPLPIQSVFEMSVFRDVIFGKRLSSQFGCIISWASPHHFVNLYIGSLMDETRLLKKKGDRLMRLVIKKASGRPG